MSKVGAGIAQWLERRTRDWKVAGLNPCWNGGRIFFSMVDFLCWPLFRYPFHPRVTTVARKKSRSFCQKCRWQVTAKHAYTLRMWLLLNRGFGIGHNLSLICQTTSEDIKHQLIIIMSKVPTQWLKALNKHNTHNVHWDRGSYQFNKQLTPNAHTNMVHTHYIMQPLSSLFLVQWNSPAQKLLTFWSLLASYWL